MAAVQCPSCRETVRLPSTELSAGASVCCPWCRETQPASRWIAKLPPLATVVDSVDVFEESPEMEQPIRDESGEELPGDGVDLDDDVVWEESHPNGVSVTGGEADFPSEITVQQPTLDEIEDAWDAPDDDWGKPRAEQISLREASHEASHDRDSFDGSVDEAFYERRYRPRRRNAVVRILKMASPSLIALPIIVAIWYVSGFDISTTSGDRDPDTLLADAATSVAADSALPNRVGASPTDPSSQQEDSIAMISDRVAEPLVPVDEAAATQPAEPTTVAAIASRNAQPDAAPNTGGEMELLLQDLRAEAPLVEAADGESSEGSQSSPAKTVWMRAQEQLARRGNDEADAGSEIEVPPSEQPVLRFPSETPSVSEIIQASAESENTAGPPDEAAIEFSPATPQTSPETSPRLPQDEPEFVAACEKVLRAIAALPPADDRSREATLARLTTFRELSQLGDHSFPAASPAVAEVLDRLAEPSRVESGEVTALAELCAAWIGWSKRTTDGMLLVGRFTQSGEAGSWQLSDGTRLEVELSAADCEVPTSGRVIALAKIVSADQPPTVKLLAYRKLPDR